VSSEARSLIDGMLHRRDLFFSKGYLNSEGRKLVAKLLRLLAVEDPSLFRRVKRLYPEAPEDRWLSTLQEVRDELASRRRA